MIKRVQFLVGIFAVLLLYGTRADIGATQKRPGNEQSQKVQMPVRVGRIVRLDAAHHRLVLRSHGHTWSAPLTTTPLVIKNGVSVELSAFQPGDTAVVQGYPDVFTSSISDPESFAAFVRDEQLTGEIESLDSKTRTLTFRGTFMRLKEWSSPKAFVVTAKFTLSPTTQFWLTGKRLTRSQAVATLPSGTPIHVIRRFDSSKPCNNLAYALFDNQSWRQYAKAELRDPQKVYQPTKTVMPNGHDTGP